MRNPNARHSPMMRAMAIILSFMMISSVIVIFVLALRRG